MYPILVTGAAGFIGSHVAERLLARGESVIGVDNFNTYYNPDLKEARVARLMREAGFRMVRMDFSDARSFAALLCESGAQRVIHLGAQAGVRFSLEDPFAYERANVAGHLSVLEACRYQSNFKHLVYASSSSVYGDRPSSGAAFREDDRVDAPASFYAATKRTCELMSTTYGRLFGLPQSGLRFFTVYGPWGRPDMAYYSFAQKIISGEPIEIYGEGRLRRDFTYIDDVVDGIIGVLDRPPELGENRLLNIGNDKPQDLLTFITLLEQSLGREAIRILRPMQPGDVTETWADLERIHALTGYVPKVTLSEGLNRFVAWFRGMH